MNINWFLKTNSVPKDSESDIDSDDELYTSENEKEYVYTELGKANNTTTIVKMAVYNFIQISCWEYNRPLDRTRVKQLGKAIETDKQLLGAFSVAELDDKWYLIDGQHRQQALIDSCENTDSNCADLDVIIMVYKVCNEDDIVELFKKINNTKPLDPRETPNTIIMSAVNQLETEFPKAIHTKNKTVYPYILKKELAEKLRTFKDIENMTSDQLVSIVRKKNSAYSRMHITDIPNIAKRLTVGAVEKARNSGFYLGLDRRWSWIDL